MNYRQQSPHSSSGHYGSPEPAGHQANGQEQGHTMQAGCRHRTRVGSRVLSPARGLPHDRRPYPWRPRLRGGNGQHALVIAHGSHCQELRRSPHSHGNIQLVLSSCVWIADTLKLLCCAPPTWACWLNASSATTSECSECKLDPNTATPPPPGRRSVPSQGTHYLRWLMRAAGGGSRASRGSPKCLAGPRPRLCAQGKWRARAGRGGV
jgi:hypothetical protein